MVRIKTVTGVWRMLFLLRLHIIIFFHYVPAVVSGRLTPARFLILLRRLLLFLSRLRHNKFVIIDGATRLDLYVPSFPGKAFYTACDKFTVFDRRLPCVTALVSVTSACRFDCAHCYQKRDMGKDVSIDLLVSAVRTLQDHGVAFFNIEGGEPFLAYDRLKKICASIDRRSEVWVNSTGDAMTPHRLRELKRLNLTAIMFSLHTADPATLNAFMGSETAWQKLEQGIAFCHETDVPVSFNTCIPKQDFFNGRFDAIMEKAKEFGACLVQLIKPKPAGGRMELGVESYTDKETSHITGMVNRYNHDPRYRSYPPIAAQFIEESPKVFGCTAGGTDRFYINAKGDVQPCEFLNISFGNIAQEDFPVIYDRMRACFDPPGQTWLCEGYAQKIAALAQDAVALPLDLETSKQVYETWDRGKETELYQKVGNINRG
ncbi:MAG: radical SAM protein [Chitinispirillaceae bacterium]|nr:radical SAM protein [Chitinispirillaceae bacterium]